MRGPATFTGEQFDPAFEHHLKGRMLKALTLPILAVLDWPGIPLRPEPGSTIAEGVDKLHFFLTGITFIFTVIIFSTIFYFAIKYRRRAGNLQPAETKTISVAGNNVDGDSDAHLRGHFRLELQFIF